MAGSMSGQDEANSVLWLATRMVKMEPSWLLGMARCVPARKRFTDTGSKSFLFVICTKKQIFLSQPKDFLSLSIDGIIN